MKKYIVEFWPSVKVEVEASDPEDALLQALHKSDGGWPGGSEHMAHGIRFVAWVREVAA